MNSSLIQSGVSPCPPASRPFTRRRRRRRSTSRSVLCIERDAVQSCTPRPSFCFPSSAFSLLPLMCSFLPPGFLILLPATFLEYAPSYLLSSLVLRPIFCFSFLLPSFFPVTCSFLPRFPHILLPSSRLPSFCFLLPSSLVLMTTSFPAYSASLLLPSLILLLCSCLPLFWCPPPSWNILLPISFPTCPASNVLLPVFCLPSFCFPPPSWNMLLPTSFFPNSASYSISCFPFLFPFSFLSCAPDNLLSRLFCFLFLLLPLFRLQNLLGRFKFRVVVSLSYFLTRETVLSFHPFSSFPVRFSSFILYMYILASFLWRPLICIKIPSCLAYILIARTFLFNYVPKKAHETIPFFLND